MKNVVTIGGGNGTAITVNALKKFISDINLSVVVGMSDSGSSSCRLRKEFGVLPPGDIMRAVLSLSPYDYLLLKRIFYKNRFNNLEKLEGHNLGNLFLTFISRYSDFVTALRALEQSVEAMAHVYPNTLESNNLVAELENGDIVFGEHEIDEPKYDKNLQIKKVWLETEKAKDSPEIYLETKQALENADYIFLGPGDLYTSIIATTLPKGFKEALEKSKAKIIYIFGNIRHLDGETGPKTFSESVLALESYLGRKIDLVIYDNHSLNAQEKEKYKTRGWELVPCDKENLPEHEILEVDFEKTGGGLESEKLVEPFGKIMGLK